MDEAYNQHASHVRRKNRSTSNLNRLTLAPLTTRFPLADTDAGYFCSSSAAAPATTSYLQGRSAPTTPGLISHSPGPYSPRPPSRPGSKSGTRSGAATPGLKIKSAMKKSKSTTQLVASLAATTNAATATTVGTGSAPRQSKSGYTTPSRHSNHRRRALGDLSAAESYGDSDWLHRAGALLSTEARESKGQAWLVSRESSTSLAGMGLGVHDTDAEAFERELARERAVASRMASRRSSVQFSDTPRDDDEAAEYEGDGEIEAVKRGSRRGSRPGSRSGGSWSQAMTPLDHASPFQRRHLHQSSDYPSHHHHNHHNHHHHQHSGGDGSGHESRPGHVPTPGPDFVNLDEKLEGIARDMARGPQDDEAVVRKLVRRSNSGLWSLFGFTLFSVAEGDDDDEEEDDDDEDDDADADDAENIRSARARARASRALRHFEGVSGPPEERIPAPGDDEGGWKDAAWLLSVATRVFL